MKEPLKEPLLYGDFSLNTANVLTAREFLDQGLASLTPTHDLNAAQLADLARSFSNAATEAAANGDAERVLTGYLNFTC